MRVLETTAGGGVYSLDERSGCRCWGFKAEGGIRGGVTVGRIPSGEARISRTSDAVLALELATGRLLWSSQMTGRDAFTIGCALPTKTNCPRAAGPDLDFGRPPILVRIGERSRALVIAQKSAMAYALDPDRSGAVLWRTRVGRGGSLGGSQ